jgi:hypothetical protein
LSSYFYLQKLTTVDALEGQRLLFDDLAVEIEDEYDPMVPNNYEKVIRDRKEEHDRIREEEVMWVVNLSHCAQSYSVYSMQ